MFSVGQIQQSGEVGNNSTFQLPIFCEMFLSKNIKILRRVLELQLEMSGILFFRAMLCIRGTSHGPVSVRLSVRHKSVFYRNG